MKICIILMYKKLTKKSLLSKFIYGINIFPMKISKVFFIGTCWADLKICMENYRTKNSQNTAEEGKWGKKTHPIMCNELLWN